METTVTKNRNGNGKETDAVNTGKKGEVLVVKIDKPGVEVTPAKTEVKTPQPESIEQRKDRIHKLQLLSDRHDELKQELKKLQEFQISHDSDKCKLAIADDKGKEFRSSNPEAIKIMIEICLKSIAAKMAAVEADILK